MIEKTKEKGIVKMLYYILIAIILLLLISSGINAIFIIIGFTIILIFVNTKFKQKNIVKNDFRELSGEDFEIFCVCILEKNSFKNIIRTKASGDHGIDILAERFGVKYAIQCKYYSNNVGNKAVQEAYSGKGIYDAQIAVVMTNSYFTKQAIEDAEKLNVELWDADKLDKLCGSGVLDIQKKIRQAESKTGRYIEPYAMYCNKDLVHEDKEDMYEEYKKYYLNHDE